MTTGYKVPLGHHPEVLASGRTAAPGEFIPADAIDPTEQPDVRLLAEGLLIEASLSPDAELAGDELQDRARALDIHGRSDMSADELRAAIAEAESRTPEVAQPDITPPLEAIPQPGGLTSPPLPPKRGGRTR